MSEKNAHKFLLSMRRLGDRLDRIENVLGSGMPDTNICFGGFECWIETKQPKEPKRETTPLFGSNHDLSQQQRNWILGQLNAGGNAIIYIQTDRGFRMFIGGEHADAVNQRNVGELLALSFWDNGIRGSGGDAARTALIAYCLRRRK